MSERTGKFLGNAYTIRRSIALYSPCQKGLKYRGTVYLALPVSNTTLQEESNVKINLLLNGDDLVFIPSQEANQAIRKKSPAISLNLWQLLVKPRIWQSQHKGRTVWHAYESSTGKTITCLT